MFHRSTILSLAVAALLAVPSLAAAQNAPPTRVRGAIEALDGLTLKVKSREGESVTVQLADNYTVGGITTAQLSDIKPGSFVGSAAMPMAGGGLRALEVLIFPDAMRGSNEGHYPWDLQPESTMTNATVAEAAGRAEGQMLTLKYKDGEQTIMVPADVPIVTFTSADKSELVPGAKVFVPAMKQPDGTLRAGRVLVGKNGIMPPM